MFAPNTTLYFTFTHTAAIAPTAFTTALVVNGELDLSIPITIKENSAGIYTASFNAPLVNETVFHLVVYETATPTNKYHENWFVRARTVEKTLGVISSGLSQKWSSDLGF